MASVWTFEAIGTRWNIETDTPLEPEFKGRITQTIARFDAEWSRFRPDSLVTLLADGATPVSAPPDTAAMLNTYVELSAATGGAINPLVGGALSRRGYTATGITTDHGASTAPADWEWLLTDYRCVQAAVAAGQLQGFVEALDVLLDP